MLSANSSIQNKHTASGWSRVFDVFQLEFTRHQVWLFLMTSLVLMLEPFVIYLLGLDSKNQQVKENLQFMLEGGKPLQLVLHLLLIGPIFIIGSMVLSRQIFSFLHDKRDSDRVLSLPFSRSSLFWGKVLAAALILAIPLAVDAIVLQFVLANPLNWQLGLLRIYLSSLTLFMAMIVFQSRNGRYFPALLEASGLFIFIPLLSILLSVYAVGSRPNAYRGHLWEWIFNYPILHGNMFVSPLLTFFLPWQVVKLPVLRIVSLLFFGAWAWLQFIRRAGEKSGYTAEAGKMLGIQEILFVCTAGVLGGFFVEAVSDYSTVVGFFCGFFIFGLVAAFAVMQLRFKKILYKRAAAVLLVSLVLMSLFQVACRHLPLSSQRLQNIEEIDTISIRNQRLDYGSTDVSAGYSGDPRQRFSLRLDPEKDKAVIADLAKLCQIELSPYRESPFFPTVRQEFEDTDVINSYSAFSRDAQAEFVFHFKDGSHDLAFLPFSQQLEGQLRSILSQSQRVNTIYQPERVLGRAKEATIYFEFDRGRRPDLNKLKKHPYLKKVAELSDNNEPVKRYNLTLSEKGLDALWEAIAQEAKDFSTSHIAPDLSDSQFLHIDFHLTYDDPTLPIPEDAVEGYSIEKAEKQIRENGLHIYMSQFYKDPALADFLNEIMPGFFGELDSNTKGEQ